MKTSEAITEQSSTIIEQRLTASLKHICSLYYNNTNIVINLMLIAFDFISEPKLTTQSFFTRGLMAVIMWYGRGLVLQTNESAKAAWRVYFLALATSSLTLSLTMNAEDSTNYYFAFIGLNAFVNLAFLSVKYLIFVLNVFTFYVAFFVIKIAFTPDQDRVQIFVLAAFALATIILAASVRRANRIKLAEQVEVELIFETEKNKIIEERQEVEKRTQAVFDNIPIGILSITTSGEIEEGYSVHLQKLFPGQKIAKENVFDVVFKDATDELRVKEMNAVQALNTIVGSAEVLARLVIEDLPSKITIAEQTKMQFVTNKYIAVRYHAVIKNNVVRKLILILEDRTDLMAFEKEKEKYAIYADPMLQKLALICTLGKDFIEIAKKEMPMVLENLATAIRQKNIKQVKVELHCVKGNFAIMEWTSCADRAHLAETYLDMKNSLAPQDWSYMESEFNLIWKEWVEFYELTKVSSQSDKIPQYFTQEQAQIAAPEDRPVESVNSLESLIRRNIEKTARELHKEVDLQVIHDDKEPISNETRSNLSEILIHLTNNSIDHGIEFSQDRIEQGKVARGEIVIKIKAEGNVVAVDFKDNGRGISVEKVKSAAIKKGLLTEKEAKVLSRTEALRLILKEDVSSKEKISKISGRGVGLSAVHEIVKSDGFEIEIDSHEGVGTQFKFNLRNAS